MSNRTEKALNSTGRHKLCSANNVLTPLFQGLALFLVLVLTSLVLSSESQANSRYASIVMDSRTGQVLFSRNADKRLYPASLTKIMTLYMTFDALKKGRFTLDTRLRVSARAAGQTPTKLGLKKGETITVRDAMFGLITKSANDAATVLAEAMAPTEAAFARLMTDRARKLGMSRTSFRNASGLPNRRQKSTARDMALLGAAIIHDFPEYYDFLSLQSFEYKGRKFKNHNNLLGKYAGADGIKTGYIRASGFNLVASAKRGDNRLIGVVFGGRNAKSRDRHMTKLLDKGFERIEQMRAYAIPLPLQRPVNIALGMNHGNNRTQVAAAKPAQIAQAPRPSQTTAVPTPPKQSTTAFSDGKWGIQVGAFSRAGKARDQLNLAISRSDAAIESGRYNIQKVTHNGTPIYRAQMIGFTEAQARNLCRNLIRQSITCFIVTPETGNLMRVALN
ncbi:D-alanyl-D-alanine carboxypeptidase [Sneathiella glossodoripedis]|uniref:D-alanyl-D-alanine carboxypeptidase n=1 Tax=Sneathiella glossodoripedis TaxID=418853 RepID=UPI0018FF607C|nr:D-alanyl-D-alanine carboxypeptidase [Sneathiella glossodoripedis]